jgi:hypothetical protein
MKKLLDIAQRYIDTSDWKTITVLKFCLLALGMLFGMAVGEKQKKSARVVAATVFLATYIPLMAKLAHIVRVQGVRSKETESDEEEWEDVFETGYYR